MDCTATAAGMAGPESPPDRRVPLENWSAMVKELLDEHDMSQPQIADWCGCAQSAVSDLLRGVTKDPRHRIGERLKLLLTTKRSEAPHKAASASAPAAGAGEEARG